MIESNRHVVPGDGDSFGLLNDDPIGDPTKWRNFTSLLKKMKKLVEKESQMKTHGSSVFQAVKRKTKKERRRSMIKKGFELEGDEGDWSWDGESETDEEKDKKQKKDEKKFLIVYPESTILAVWPFLNLATTVYTSVIAPIRLTFLTEIPGWWTVFEYFIDLMIGTDIIITLNTAYYDAEGFLVDSRLEIFWANLKSWLVFDVLSIFPFFLLSTGSSEEDGSSSGLDNASELFKLLRIVRLYRLFRLFRLAKFFNKIKKNTHFSIIVDYLQINVGLSNIIRRAIIFLICIHYITCFYFFTALFYDLGPGTWVYELQYTEYSTAHLYLVSLYWTVSTLTTVGLGNVHSFSTCTPFKLSLGFKIENS